MYSNDEINNIESGIIQLRSKFNKDLLDDSSDINLLNAYQAARDSYEEFADRVYRKRYNSSAIPTWGFRIEPEEPLLFKPSHNADDIETTVDISCKFAWALDLSNRPGKLRRPAPIPHRLIEGDLLVRIWCATLTHAYRPEYDSDEIGLHIHGGGRRVLSRWHFDYANLNQEGPKTHIQIGGKQLADEHCWFPEALKMPRMLCAPMDLFLVIEIVCANFFPKAYNALSEEVTWHSVITNSQGRLQRTFFQDAVTAINSNESVLRSNWNLQSWG